MEASDGSFSALSETCPACGRAIIHLQIITIEIPHRILVYPKGISRPAPPAEVPSDFTTDFIETCKVLDDSPRASAALSRYCLQRILREKAGVKKGDLANEIQEALNSGKLPAHLTESLDAVRNIGNFAAHPSKSQATGQIVQVEPGEAEWNLNVLEALFDFYFVQPELTKRKRAALNVKLADIGKPPMK